MRDHSWRVASHTKLRAFALADEVVLLIYRVTKGFSKEEIYGLTSQMRKAAVSVPSNIVEGCARGTQAEYLCYSAKWRSRFATKHERFLEIAFGSARELHYQFGLASRLGYTNELDVPECDSKMVETDATLQSGETASLRSTRKVLSGFATLRSSLRCVARGFGQCATSETKWPLAPQRGDVAKLTAFSLQSSAEGGSACGGKQPEYNECRY